MDDAHAHVGVRRAWTRLRLSGAELDELADFADDRGVSVEVMAQTCLLRGLRELRRASVPE